MFTVVIPAHNAEATLPAALASVARQSLMPSEVLVIDDASIDRTLDVASHFENDLPLRTLIRNEPGPGGYAARNYGVAQAQNQWIAFLDSDDSWTDEHLSTLEAAMREFPHYRFFTTGRLLVTSELDGKCHPDFFTLAARETYDEMKADDLLEAMLAGRSPALTSCVAVDKDAFHHAGSFPAGKVKRGGDEDLWVRLVLNGHKLLRINKSTTLYTWNRLGSVTNDKTNIQGLHPIYQTAEVAKNRMLGLEIIRKLDSLANEKQLSWLRDAGGYRHKLEALKTLSFSKLTLWGRLRFLLWLASPSFVDCVVRSSYRAAKRKIASAPFIRQLSNHAGPDT